MCLKKCCFKYAMVFIIVLTLIILGGCAGQNKASNGEVSGDVFAGIEGTGNSRTPVFEIAKEESNFINFFIMLDDFPTKKVTWDVKLFRQGDEDPVEIYKDEVTPEELQRYGWSPSHEEHWGDKGFRGAAGGMAGFTFPGPPGEYYFEIKVNNVDRWYIQVGEIVFGG